MSETTTIAWTDHSWSPWWGCSKVSAGCAHCYAEGFDKRVGGAHWGPGAARRTMSPAHWREPLKWNAAAWEAGERRRVFPSMCDPFDAEAPEGERARLWALIHETPWLDWLLLTKRPENVAAMLPALWGDGWANVWLGVSVEDAAAVGRLDVLRAVPAVRRFVSAEPLIGPWTADLSGFAWLIVGGESGGKRRPLDMAWVRALHGCARHHGAAFFAKQDSGQYPGDRGRIPDDLWVQESPR